MSHVILAVLSNQLPNPVLVFSLGREVKIDS